MSNSEAKRLIRQGALKINGVTVTDPYRIVSSKDAVDGVIRITIGKKRHLLVRAA